MEEEDDQSALDRPSTAVEAAKSRCISLRHRIDRNFPPPKTSNSCQQTLLRLVNAELRHLSRLSPSDLSHPLSLNLGYLESIVRIIEHPSVTGVSRICKPVPSSTAQSKPVHVDVVCTLSGKPVWFIVSDRNPNFITWSGSHGERDDLKAKVERILSVARSAVSLKPHSVIFFFSKGLGEGISKSLIEEFSALEMGKSFYFADFDHDRAFEIKVDEENCAGDCSVIMLPAVDSLADEIVLDSSEEFCKIVCSLKKASEDTSNLGLVNFDTTALIALISGISNGGAERVLNETEDDLKGHFKGNCEFVLAQAKSELQNPILPEMALAITAKNGIVCETALAEFKELVSMYGGQGEKARADLLLKSVRVVADYPSTRVSALPTTRKMPLKNKKIFGTGDQWHALTLSANEGFLRAVCQSGMSLLALVHRPRALIKV
ncbi:uncharacterized protein LOC144699916 [Wolffia australiana]